MIRITTILGSAVAALALGSACSNDATPSNGSGQTDQALTYWQDAVPIFETHCLGCHQENGIGPFRLDDYQQAKIHAPAIRSMTQTRTMPPWAATSDGTCGTFSGSLALSDEQIQTIAAWIDGGLQEGTPGVIDKPTLPTLAGATDFSTPHFAPERQGGELAEFDEYRCFPLDSGLTSNAFITGYEVVPGTPEIVHHVLVSIVDPDALDSAGDKTNAEQMQALDDESPDRIGWPCFSTAGDGVEAHSVPVVWAPGQGVVSFPRESGVPLRPRDKIVVQVHYNLADPLNVGKTDDSKVRLRIVPTVQNVGLFVLYDPFLGSLGKDPPTTLAPASSSVKYTWQSTIAQFGLGDVPGLELEGVMPHMHQLGRKYRMTIDEGAGASCAADVQNWNFHWQRMYFYAAPRPMVGLSAFQVTCDFDTSERTDPVLPGWGTRNEMCLATLYFTAPLAALGNP